MEALQIVACAIIHHLGIAAVKTARPKPKASKPCLAGTETHAPSRLQPEALVAAAIAVALFFLWGHVTAYGLLPHPTSGKETQANPKKKPPTASPCGSTENVTPRLRKNR